jgi:hypothetical protein
MAILGAAARASLEAALDRLHAAGMTVLTQENGGSLATVEAATGEAFQVTMGIMPGSGAGRLAASWRAMLRCGARVRWSASRGHRR